jgi:rubredoxin
MSLLGWKKKPSMDAAEASAQPKSGHCPQCGAPKEKAIEASPLGPPELRQLLCGVCAFEYPAKGVAR